MISTKKKNAVKHSIDISRHFFPPYRPITFYLELFRTIEMLELDQKLSKHLQPRLLLSAHYLKQLQTKSYARYELLNKHNKIIISVYFWNMGLIKFLLQ